MYIKYLIHNSELFKKISCLQYYDIAMEKVIYIYPTLGMVIKSSGDIKYKLVTSF